MAFTKLNNTHPPPPVLNKPPVSIKPNVFKINKDRSPDKDSWIHGFMVPKLGLVNYRQTRMKI